MESGQGNNTCTKISKQMVMLMQELEIRGEGDEYHSCFSKKFPSPQGTHLGLPAAAAQRNGLYSLSSTKMKLVQVTFYFYASEYLNNVRAQRTVKIYTAETAGCQDLPRSLLPRLAIPVRRHIIRVAVVLAV